MCETVKSKMGLLCSVFLNFGIKIMLKVKSERY